MSCGARETSCQVANRKTVLTVVLPGDFADDRCAGPTIGSEVIPPRTGNAHNSPIWLHMISHILCMRSHAAGRGA
eukprot:4796190-Amphidinium_carterae.1